MKINPLTRPVKHNIHELCLDFYYLLFPNVCLHCNTILLYQEKHLCTKCRFSLPKTHYHLLKDNPLEQKFVYEPRVKGVAAFLHYHTGGIAQHLIHSMKYKEQPEIGTLMGRLYGAELLEAPWQIDCIVPVPLHQSKLEKRGFNQSEKFGEGLSEVMEVPMNTELVRRVKRTATQTRKSKVERWQNTQDIYKVMAPYEVARKSILIVDDVLTTGATAGQLVSALVLCQAKRVYIATIAAGK